MEVGDFVLRWGMFNLGGHHEVQAHKFKFKTIGDLVLGKNLPKNSCSSVQTFLEEVTVIRLYK